MKGCIYIISDSFESSEIKGSANLNTKFQDVWKFPNMSRLYHPSFFGARINVSTKEYLWNPSFNANFFFLQRFWVFKPNKDVRIRRVGAVGRDVRCESGFMRKWQLFTLTLVTKSLVYMVFWIFRGECREKKKQVRLNTKQSFKKIVSALTISDTFLSILG